MKKLSAGQWFIVTAILAFGSVISFFQINSAWADAHDFNGIFGWLGIGIVAGLAAIFGLSKVIKNSN
jgi:hypothetical protein